MSIAEAQMEFGKSLTEMRKDYAALKEMKEQLEQTGAQLQEDSKKESPPLVQSIAPLRKLDQIR